MSPNESDHINDDSWAAGISLEWAEELGNSKEDIYTLDDGNQIID